MRSIPDPIFRSLLRKFAAAGAIAFGIVSYVYLMLPDVRPLSTTNPTRTAFMKLRDHEDAAAGRTKRRVQQWVPYTRISQHLKRAVIVAEDGAFFEHEGIDVEEIKKSVQTAFERGSSIRGASTITQQLAKNLYLSPSRDPLRKLRELVITRRLEVALPKARIFEIYLNVIEWGDQIWGAEAAARTYFHVSASGLSREQSALLAGAIINPRTYSPARPPRRLLGRQQLILARMGYVEPPAPLPVEIPQVLVDQSGNPTATATDEPDSSVPAGEDESNPIPPDPSPPPTQEPPR
jgi:monofunctional biosynthetic peptidoglycan transglycosylase